MDKFQLIMRSFAQSEEGLKPLDLIEFLNLSARLQECIKSKTVHSAEQKRIFSRVLKATKGVIGEIESWIKENKVKS